MTGKQRKQFWNVIQITLILIAAFIMLIPIIWIFLAAFKTHVDVYQLKLFFTPTLENSWGYCVVCYSHCNLCRLLILSV